MYSLVYPQSRSASNLPNCIFSIGTFFLSSSRFMRTTSVTTLRLKKLGARNGDSMLKKIPVHAYMPFVLRYIRTNSCAAAFATPYGFLGLSGVTSDCGELDISNTSALPALKNFIPGVVTIQ